MRAGHGPVTRPSASGVETSRRALGVPVVPLQPDGVNVGGMLEVDVVGVRVDMPGNQPIVLLREVGGDRYLPIWIGAGEASAIAFAQQGVVPARPLTHDLLRDVLVALGRPLERIRITELKDGVFYAELDFTGGPSISARPSDSIALALRTGTKIFVEESVLTNVGIAVPDEHENQVEKFRDFLDNISADDFAGEA